jgi:cell division protein FtsZ
MYRKSGNAIIKVIGVGGSGCNAITHMATNEIEGVQFISINTDSQSLSATVESLKIQIGDTITKGLGAGANPEVGKQAAEADLELIIETVKGADMVFITCGMGGGTGTGAAPVIAKAIKELGILTVGVVTKPFTFEGNRRMDHADNGIQELRQQVDALLVIPNEKLSQVFGSKTNLFDAFAKANEVLHNAVQGISEIITTEGFINVDFNDVKTVMKESGTAMMGMGVSNFDSEDKAESAARKAIDCPLLEEADLSGARGLIINVSSDGNIDLGDFSKIGETIKEIAHKDATIIMGTSIDQSLNGAIKVTIIATGLVSSQNTKLKAKEGQLFGKLIDTLGKQQASRKIEVCDEDEMDIKVDNKALSKQMDQEELNITAIDNERPPKKQQTSSIIPSFLRKNLDNNKE